MVVKLAKSKNINKKFNHAQMLSFWRFEYTKRKFLLDYPKLSDQALTLAKAYREAQFYTALMYPTLVITEQILMLQRALIAYHNHIIENPKERFPDGFDGEYWEMSTPLLGVCCESLALLQEVVFQYGFFIEDLWKFTSGESIVSMFATNQNPILPRECPMKDSDKDWCCKFNYSNEAGKQFFDIEKEGWIYLYSNPFANEEEARKQIQHIPGILKKSKNKKIFSDGNQNTAIFQICISKKTPLKPSKDLMAYCNLAIDKLLISASSFVLLCDEGSENFYAQLWWAIHGLDFEQFPTISRSYGLWLWDLIEKGGLGLEAAMDYILKNTKHPYPADLYDIPTAHRLLEHTRASVNHMSVLHLTGKQKKQS